MIDGIGGWIAASKDNPLGLIALIVTLIAIVSLQFLKTEHPAVKLGWLTALLIGAGLLVIVITHPNENAKDGDVGKNDLESTERAEVSNTAEVSADNAMAATNTAAESPQSRANDDDSKPSAPAQVTRAQTTAAETSDDYINQVIDHTSRRWPKVTVSQDKNWRITYSFLDSTKFRKGLLFHVEAIVERVADGQVVGGEPMTKVNADATSGFAKDIFERWICQKENLTRTLVEDGVPMLVYYDVKSESTVRSYEDDITSCT